jgi:hypothetical protein
LLQYSFKFDDGAVSSLARIKEGRSDFNRRLIYTEYTSSLVAESPIRDAHDLLPETVIVAHACFNQFSKSKPRQSITVTVV